MTIVDKVPPDVIGRERALLVSGANDLPVTWLVSQSLEERIEMHPERSRIPVGERRAEQVERALLISEECSNAGRYTWGYKKLGW